MRLHYAEQGDRAGQPVVLLHGITDSWHSFETVMAHLPPSLHVFALSQRGHGDSDRPGRYRTRDFAADAAAFIEALELARRSSSAIRWAASNAMRLAIDRPELVRGLVAAGAFAAFSTNAASSNSIATRSRRCAIRSTRTSPPSGSTARSPIPSRRRSSTPSCARR